jgi:hypothetical protein
VGPNFHFAFAPGQIHIWVMALKFGDIAHSIGKSQGIGKIVKGIRFLNMALSIKSPSGFQLTQQFLNF